jgi:hypothetical protein
LAVPIILALLSNQLQLFAHLRRRIAEKMCCLIIVTHDCVQIEEAPPQTPPPEKDQNLSLDPPRGLLRWQRRPGHPSIRDLSDSSHSHTRCTLLRESTEGSMLLAFFGSFCRPSVSQSQQLQFWIPVQIGVRCTLSRYIGRDVI